MPIPEPRDPGEGADPPTVRSSGLPVGSLSGGSSSRRGGEAARTEVPPLPIPGERVGDFGLEEAIGAGGMGAVFRAVDIKLDRQIALKILPPDQAVDPEVVQRYYQEGRAAARLDHENIARVYSIGHDGRYHYIAFEYIEGTTIRQRVEAGGPLPVGDAINYTLQIANALVHSSGRSVVHRDIKPSNIIVTPQGRAKLVDMGLARRFERGQDNGLTQSGMTLGTFDYISPEQARDPRDVDVRGDLYSLGCTLYHMLSGRPPFPEGTVLQKLLQHQEELAPDIRKLNPAVPDDLASILVKLMAKDRDRRYQSPEQLVRDLLTVAGALGLRSINPEGLVWMAPSLRSTPAWARQLVWGLPALAFLVIVGVMAWWGDGPPSPVGEPVATIPPAKSRRPEPSSAPKPPAPALVELPREFPVESREDLLRVLLEAPPRSTILLTDEGPYDLRGTSPSRTLKGLDLAIRAGPGVRPLLRISRNRNAATDPTALLDLVGGRLTIEGVDFLVETPGSPAAIRADGAELIIRRCSFRLPDSLTSQLRPTAIVLKTTARKGSADRGGVLSVESSEFDPGQVAISTSGPVEVSLRDCTFGPTLSDQATIWAENGELGSGPAEFRISHISVLAGAGPVFRLSGIAPRVRVSESAFAPPTLVSASPTLVAIDSPDRLDWRGLDNIYGRFGSFLQPLRANAARPPIRTYEAWADDPLAFREAGSTLVEGHPWEESNPLDALAPGALRPARAFQLALSRLAPTRPGARQGPAGPIPAPTVVATIPASNLVESPTPAPAPASTSTDLAMGDRRVRPGLDPPRPREVPSASTPSASSPKPKPPVAEPDDAMRAMPLALPAEKPGRIEDADGPTGLGEVTTMPMPVDPERPSAPTTTTTTSTTSIPSPTLVGPPKPVPSNLVASVTEPNVIRDPDEFQDTLARIGSASKPLIIAADADWSLPPCRVRGMSSWVIRAERGATRPRIRFRPDPAASAPAESWSAWMTVEASGLRLEGIDLVLPAPVPAIDLSARRRAAFAVAPGTIDLTLVDCSVTIEGDSGPGSAVMALLPGDLGGEGRLRIKDCLLRVGGDLVDIAGGRRLDLEIDNAAIAAGGSLVHAHGLPEGRVADELKVVLRQVTARLLGGLAHLQSTPLEPELPVASINARDAILATGDPDAPLLRVDGQGNLDDLRALIRWEGRAVAYHQLNIYRRDQSAQPGAVPTLYDRDFWNFTLGRRDESPTHGDAGFQTEWPPARRPWTLRKDDFRLRLDSPAVGADLPHVPSPTIRLVN